MLQDERILRLAKTLVHHSLQVEAGDNIVIYASVVAKPLVLALIDELKRANANPFVEVSDDDYTNALYKAQNQSVLDLKMKWLNEKLKDVDGFISIQAHESDYVNADVSQQVLDYRKAMQPLQKTRLAKKWVLLNYPTPGAAHKAKMSYSDYVDFMLDVMNVDYPQMGLDLIPLQKWMEKTDKVRLVSPGTDLTFSIKDINVVPCYGQNNVPDGEIYTAPVKHSVNGTITYNTPSPYRGIVFKNVSLTFKDGKIIQCSSDQNQELLEGIFDTDDGARFVGEFAIGVNPMITKPMTDILYDEKIMGSIHFTPGMSYDSAPNGNDSAIHWDLVLIQTPEFGGGEIWFDDVLIRKDGLFVIDELKPLNP
ncbi:MAG: aminopeptidase [Bacilli bacterium]|nr:aminopeptidase [Bacilli bacterium]MBN2877391.1 aminopeptidase [Bacilli bacterium]